MFVWLLGVCVRIGIVLTLLSCFVQGCQYVFEEKLMVEDNAAPLLVVGMEGAWGTMLMVTIVFPWASMLPGSDEGGCLENIYDSWTMIQNSLLLQWLLLLFFVSVFLYNIFAILVTFMGNSIWHAILENYRPGAVWAMDLLLYYVLSSHSMGEAWTHWSWMELTGMIAMLIGTGKWEWNGFI